ncbi:MAG: hypothetical protein IPK69_07420 [Phycisphaerales bacterium]|nr:MAG: hypothetical protein IPK69_07420 [Phycisphaerales bacterium]
MNQRQARRLTGLLFWLGTSLGLAIALTGMTWYPTRPTTSPVADILSFLTSSIIVATVIAIVLGTILGLVAAISHTSGHIPPEAYGYTTPRQVADAQRSTAAKFGAFGLAMLPTSALFALSSLFARHLLPNSTLVPNHVLSVLATSVLLLASPILLAIVTWLLAKPLRTWIANKPHDDRDDPVPHCQSCNYPRTGLDQDAPCPECGMPFSPLTPQNPAAHAPSPSVRSADE